MITRIDTGKINELTKIDEKDLLKEQMKHIADMNTKSRVIALIDIIDNCDNLDTIKNLLATMFINEFKAIKDANKGGGNCTSEELADKVLTIFKAENWEIY